MIELKQLKSESSDFAAVQYLDAYEFWLEGRKLGRATAVEGPGGEKEYEVALEMGRPANGKEARAGDQICLVAGFRSGTLEAALERVEGVYTALGEM